VRAALSASLALALAASGCSHTRITASDRQARIYVDGRLAGKGTAEVRQYGPPGQVEVVARTPDGRRERSQLRRQFRAGTVLLGVLTYGLCFVVCWSYPDELTVMLPAAAPAQRGWDPQPDDPWLQRAPEAPQAGAPREGAGAPAAPPRARGW